jgi:hypothetical protein
MLSEIYKKKKPKDHLKKRDACQKKLHQEEFLEFIPGILLGEGTVT